MKKFLKILSTAALAFILAACNNNSTEEVESTSESVVESTVESEQESSETSSESVESEGSSDQAEETNDEDPNAEGVTFEFYVDGSEEPYETFVVENADDISVLEAMESIEGLDFNFNEEEGVIDQIGDYTNDYTTGQTWAYLLNGEYAEFGVVSQHVENGDTIAWYFGTADQIPMNLVPAEAGAVELDNPGMTEAAEDVAEEASDAAAE